MTLIKVDCTKLCTSRARILKCPAGYKFWSPICPSFKLTSLNQLVVILTTLKLVPVMVNLGRFYCTAGSSLHTYTRVPTGISGIAEWWSEKELFTKAHEIYCTIPVESTLHKAEQIPSTCCNGEKRITATGLNE